MMPGEKEVLFGPVLVQRRLVRRAGLEVVGAQELHVVVLVPIVLGCAEIDSAHEQQAEPYAQGASAEDRALHRRLLLSSETFGSIDRMKGAERDQAAWGTAQCYTMSSRHDMPLCALRTVSRSAAFVKLKVTTVWRTPGTGA